MAVKCKCYNSTNVTLRVFNFNIACGSRMGQGHSKPLAHVVKRTTKNECR